MVMGCVLLALWAAEIQGLPEIGRAYLLNNETMLFFWVGGLLAARPELLEKTLDISTPIAVVVVAIWVGLVLVRVWIDPEFDLAFVRKFTPLSLGLQKAAILTGVLALVLVCRSIDFDTLMRLQRHAFFVYLFHTVPIIYIVRAATSRLVPADLEFYVSFLCATAIVFVVGQTTQRYFPQIYSVVTGGRQSKV